MLSVEHIWKNYGERNHPITVLKDVSIHLNKGEFVSIIGPSGCGKSTLLNIIAGLEAPSKGDVHFEGNSIVGKTGNVALMPQNDVLFPWRTILHNVILPLELKGVPKKIAKEKALDLFPLFGLQGFEHHFPFMLSGGMRQRANFLRTYLSEKSLLLLDEPFAKLDALTRAEVQRWFLSICEKNELTVLLITHDIDEAILLSDRIYVMSGRPGEIMKEVYVNIQRPRRPDQFATKEWLSLKQSLIDQLHTF